MKQNINPREVKRHQYRRVWKEDFEIWVVEWGSVSFKIQGERKRRDCTQRMSKNFAEFMNLNDLHKACPASSEAELLQAHVQVQHSNKDQGKIWKAPETHQRHYLQRSWEWQALMWATESQRYEKTLPMCWEKIIAIIIIIMLCSWGIEMNIFTQAFTPRHTHTWAHAQTNI